MVNYLIPLALTKEIHKKTEIYQNVVIHYYTWTFFCVIKQAVLAPLTATAVFPLPVAAFMAYSVFIKNEKIMKINKKDN